jgi:hypothetical protein
MIMNTHKSSPLRPPLAAATLAAGFGTVWFALVTWLGVSILEAFPRTSQPRQESLVVATDATPVIQSFPLDNLSRVTYRGLDGQERDALERKDQIAGVRLSGEPATGGAAPARSSWDNRMKVFMDEREPSAIWYFIHDGEPQGSAYFVGYERISNRLIGYIGLSGFRTDPVPASERVPVRGELMLHYSSWSSAPPALFWGGGWGSRPDRFDVPPRLVHVPSGNSLRLADLAVRTVTTVFDAPAQIVSVGVPTLASYSGATRTKEQPILVRAGQRIYTLDHKYNVTNVLTIPAEIDRKSAVTWYQADSGQAIAECEQSPSTARLSNSDIARSTVYRIAGDGAILDSFELALQTGSKSRSERAERFLMAVGVPAPAALLGGVALMATTNEAVDYLTALGAQIKRWWPSLGVAMAVASVLAVVTWRWSCAFGLSPREQAAWTAFVLLFGVPACAGFLLHRRWPVREPCPHCHARCARDRDTCAACGTAFSAPALKGTEIFA